MEWIGDFFEWWFDPKMDFIYVVVAPVVFGVVMLTLGALWMGVLWVWVRLERLFGL